MKSKNSTTNMKKKKKLTSMTELISSIDQLILKFLPKRRNLWANQEYSQVKEVD